MVTPLQMHLVQETCHLIRGRPEQAQSTMAKVAKAVVCMMQRRYALCKHSGSTMHCQNRQVDMRSKHLQCISSQR